MTPPGQNTTHCGHSLHPVWALAHHPCSSLFKGCKLPMPCCFLYPSGALKLCSVPPSWMNDHHTLLGPLDVAYMGLPFWHCLRTDSLPSLSCFVDTLISALALISQAKCCPPTVWMFFSLLGLWFSMPGSSSSCRAPLLWYPGLGHCVSSPSSSAPPNGFRTESFRKDGEWWVFPFLIFVNLVNFLFCFSFS